MFLTEMWMKTQGDEAKCADLSSPGYTFKSFPPATRGGGLAVATREGLPVTVSASFHLHTDLLSSSKSLSLYHSMFRISVCTDHRQVKGTS